MKRIYSGVAHGGAVEVLSNRVDVLGHEKAVNWYGAEGVCVNSMCNNHGAGWIGRSLAGHQYLTYDYELSLVLNALTDGDPA